jgi:KDO2-lipid IV(A) lauroyltransferase
MARFQNAARNRAWPVFLLDTSIGYIAAGGLRLLRCFDRERMANVLGGFLRRIGPILPEHRVGRDNLRAAFPEKTPEQIETILRGAWDNLGRFVADFAHLDRLRIHDPAVPGPYEIEYTEETLARFLALRDSGKPALLFAAHLANWELPPLVAHRYGIEATVLYRRPNLPGVADAVVDMRADCMGTLLPAGLDAPFLLAKALERGEVAGMLVDQHDRRGINVNFFGQPARTSALIARLARQIDCPIHGTRVIRLPDNRFRAELTEPIPPVRDAEGRIDVDGTMQTITDVVEKWVREYPDQWLWLHRRWRAGETDPKAKYRQWLWASVKSRSEAPPPSTP